MTNVVFLNPIFFLFHQLREVTPCWWRQFSRRIFSLSFAVHDTRHFHIVMERTDKQKVGKVFFFSLMQFWTFESGLENWTYWGNTNNGKQGRNLYTSVNKESVHKMATCGTRLTDQQRALHLLEYAVKNIILSICSADYTT